jgi:hypothetical protein
MRRPASGRRFTMARAVHFAATAGILALLLISGASEARAQPAQYSPHGWIGTPNPTFTWSTVGGGVTTYHLEVESVVDGLGRRIYQIYYSPGEVCSGATCAATPANALPRGHYRWSVRAYASGWGYWSGGLEFDVAGPSAPTLIAPTGPITTPNPAYTWSAVEGSPNTTSG